MVATRDLAEAVTATAGGVATFLGVPAQAVEVTGGHSSRRKTLTVKDAVPEDVIRRIVEGLA